MEYDPIKNRLGKFFRKNIFSLRLFYFILNLLFLRTWYIHKKIKAFAKENRDNININVLDAGSGFGQYAWYISNRNKNWDVKGIDIKQTEVDYCNELFGKAGVKNAKFEQQDITTYISDKKYDLILSVDVLEHIFEDVKVLKNFYNNMKAGGVVIISTPSDKGGSDTYQEGDESFISEHVRDGYSIEDISIKLKVAGFEKINAEYSYGKAGNISWRLSVKYPAKMLNYSKNLVFFLPFYFIIIYPLCYILNTIDVNTHNKSGTGLIVTAKKLKA